MFLTRRQKKLAKNLQKRKIRHKIYITDMLPKYDEDSPKRQAYNTLDPYANMDWLSEYDSPKEAEQDGVAVYV